jgi:hypothetical protein
MSNRPLMPSFPRRCEAYRAIVTRSTTAIIDGREVCINTVVRAGKAIRTRTARGDVWEVDEDAPPPSRAPGMVVPFRRAA